MQEHTNTNEARDTSGDARRHQYRDGFVSYYDSAAGVYLAWSAADRARYAIISQDGRRTLAELVAHVYAVEAADEDIRRMIADPGKSYGVRAGLWDGPHDGAADEGEGQGDELPALLDEGPGWQPNQICRDGVRVSGYVAHYRELTGYAVFGGELTLYTRAGSISGVLDREERAALVAALDADGVPACTLDYYGRRVGRPGGDGMLYRVEPTGEEYPAGYAADARDTASRASYRTGGEATVETIEEGEPVPGARVARFVAGGPVERYAPTPEEAAERARVAGEIMRARRERDEAPANVREAVRQSHAASVEEAREAAVEADDERARQAIRIGRDPGPVPEPGRLF